MLKLIQSHTVNIYNLESKEYKCEVVNARSLLHVSRFDLFAKMYYARNRIKQHEKALSVYIQHIKAFNPDLKEPGRDDKVTLESFVGTFDGLLDYFKDNNFDDAISIVPVDEDGVILDGAHRVAALAYYNKKITILRFSGVKSKGPFDYKYFKERGLSWSICDLIANEIPLWRNDILVACLWPQMGNLKCKNIGVKYLASKFQICYIKDIKVSLKSIQTLIGMIYSSQPWVNDPKSIQYKSICCYGKSNKILRIVLMQSDHTLKDTIEYKEDLRNIFHSGKHSLHITDSVEETRELTPLILTDKGRELWQTENETYKLIEKLKERWFYFNKIQWINFKVAISKFFSKE